MDFILDIVIEFIFELILDGSMEGAVNPKVHPFIRFLLLSIIIIVYGGLVYLALQIAIKEKSFIALICAVAITIIVIHAIIKKYNERFSQRNDND